jgi:6-phosphofructokinase 1
MRSGSAPHYPHLARCSKLSSGTAESKMFYLHPHADQSNYYSSGISFFSLVAPNEELFYETVAFYLDFGFRQVAVYDRALAKFQGDTDHCANSDKETWLLVTGEGDARGTDITLKIRLVKDKEGWKDGRQDGPENGAPSSEGDWRGSNQSIVFHTPHINRIIKLLKEKNIPFQCLPSEDNIVEVYTRDPLGTLVGFTLKANPFATSTTGPPVSLKPATEDGIMNATTSRPQTPPPGGKKKRIAVMTSGGDAPGMNAAVRAVVRMTIAKGCESYAIYEGYTGLVKGGNFIKRMFWEDVRGWLSEGGTLIGTARCKEWRDRTGRLAGAKNLILNGIDALIICGGDGSLTGADIFRKEWSSLLEELVTKGDLKREQIEPHMHLNIAGLVGSIDNDMTGTDATIGCYSSLTRICQAVDYIDATAYSHSRAFVVEVMGRHCGWLALMAGVSTGADFVFLPEKPPAKEWENDMCAIISKVYIHAQTMIDSLLICFLAPWNGQA